MGDETTKREETPTRTGNAAAMREALEKIAERAEDCRDVPEENAEGAAVDFLSEAKELADAALSAPPRNCDVGTAKDQAVRKAEYCERYAPFADSNCDACPLRNYNRAQPERMVGYSCDLAWGQLPYEAPADGKAKEGADK